MSDLHALKQRIEKAEGPDRELDVLIAAALEPYRFDAPGFKIVRPIPPFKIARDQSHIRFDEGGIMDVQFFPPVTASIDAALALVERMLPGWYWMAGCAPGHGFFADLQDDVSEVRGDASTPALAILSALLSALIAKGAEHE